MAAEQVSWRQRKKDAVTAMLASGSEAGDRMRASRIAALLAVRTPPSPLVHVAAVSAGGRGGGGGTKRVRSGFHGVRYGVFVLA